jgi:hypothetical protein
MIAFCNAESRNEPYSVTNYKQNADIGLLGGGVLVFAPDAGESCVLFDMDTPSRYAIIHFTCGVVTGGIAKIELLDDTLTNNDGSEKYDQVVSGFGNSLYGTETPSVYVLSTPSNNKSALTPATNATVTASAITIDTSKTETAYESYFIIDFKQKKKGTLRLSHAGNGANFTTANGILGSSTVNTRGVLFGNRDLVRNWSFGGHTTGAWLGLEASYSNETKDHITDMLVFTTGNVKAVIIEAPLVNEWLKQTPITTFKDRLTQIKTKVNCNTVLICTTLGLKDREYGADNVTIKFEDYAQAVKDWAVTQGGEVTFIDCRAYLRNLVSSGIISDYNELYINNGHPSPLANELMYEMLKKVVDMKF